MTHLDPTLVATTVAAVCSLIATIISIHNKGSIEQVHVSINSRMDQLLKAMAASSKAEGVAEGLATAASLQAAADAKARTDKAIHDAGVAEGKESKLLSLVFLLSISAGLMRLIR